MEDLVSIIIPVYNTPTFLLEKCFDSIISQTYKHYEAIIVDSSDCLDTINFVKEFVSTNRSFRLFTSKKGVSIQRNIGLANSGGSFIAFIDSDDHISNNYLDIMIKQLVKDESDVVVPQLYKELYDNHKLVSEYMLPTSLCKISVNKDNFFIDSEKRRLVNPVKIYKKEIIKDVLFREYLSYGEDMMFNYDLSKKGFVCTFCKDAKYFFTADKNINSAEKRLTITSINIIKEMYLLIKNENHNNVNNIGGMLDQYNFVFSIFYYQIIKTNNILFAIMLVKYRFFYFSNNKSIVNFFYCFFPFLYKLVIQIKRR